MSAAPLRVLVMGFGPFLEVLDNPASRLARAVDGAIVPSERGPIHVVGRVMPVSYDRAPLVTLRLARRWRAQAIVGVGVARGRAHVCVERWGRRAASTEFADVDGVALDDLEPGGPALAASTAPVDALAAALGALVSEDAGGYVCNAWLYRVARAYEHRAAPFRPRVAFVHVPHDGLESTRLLAVLPTLWRESSIAAGPTHPPPLSPSASTS